MNVVVLQGNITKDPETTQVGKGKDFFSVTNFTVALNDAKDHTSFIKCTAFNKLGENIEKYFGKGDKICIKGELYQKVSDYEVSKNKTIKIDNTTVTVTGFSFCEKASK